MDATFAPAKKGSAIGKTKRGKGTKLRVVADGQGLPLGEFVCSASPHESTLAEETVKQVFVPEGRKINRLIGDRAYDSEALRARLAEM